MSRGRLPRREHLLETERLLREAGYDFEEVVGRKHGKLVVHVNGREETVIISGSPSDRRALKNAMGFIKRKIREWKAEAEGLVATSASAPHRTLEIDEVQHSTELHRSSNMLRLFFEGKEVRVRDRDGLPWFILADVCKALELSNPSVAAQSLDDDERAKLNLGGGREATIISESGLYTLVLRSRKAVTAGTLEHRFRKWVTNEVIPGLRMKGSEPTDWDRAVGMLKTLVRKVTDNEHAIEEIQAALTDPDAPRVPAFDLAGSVTSLKIIEMAGVKADERVRGTSAVVTRQMKNFCLERGAKAFRAPEEIDPTKRWRFPGEVARQWLFGEGQGAEIIRSHVAKTRTANARARGQMALELVKK